MILVAGGSGNLGRELVPHLRALGHGVRVLTRDPIRGQQRLGDNPEFVLGDARSPQSLEAALSSVDAVISAMTGFGPGGRGPKAVDFEGNLNLIRAAEAAGVRRFVLLSMNGAAADHPMELARMKHRAEAALRASRLDWVIVRPNAFMELWAEIVGGPIVKEGRATVFGRGDNPVNFVSTRDVARLIELAVLDPGLSRSILAVGGPENLTFNQLVALIETAAGRRARVKHIPLPLMRVLSVVMRPFKPDLAGMIEAGIAFDTVDMTFDASELRQRFPKIELTRMADILGPPRAGSSMLTGRSRQVSQPAPDRLDRFPELTEGDGSALLQARDVVRHGEV
ncbi:MAG: SDR family oxidoreductase [Candidatus Dormiibacterota bacterium]